MHEYTIIVLPEHAGERLDVFLARWCSDRGLGVSRTVLKAAIEQGLVTVNAAAVTTPHHPVKAGQGITVRLHERKTRELPAQDIPLKILFEDEHVIVIDKPAGLVVHPAPGNPDRTLVNALLHHTGQLSDINPQRPGIVHRLDKGTSGVMVAAKTNQAHLALARQFARHSIQRRYVAVVKGNVKFDEQVIEVPIGRHPVKRKSMAVSFEPHTRYARTKYRTLRRSDAVSLLDLEPFTGRTHQLRVHLAYIGHPVMGDTSYGRNNGFPRMCLHARSLGFTHPATGEFVEFSSPVPEEFLASVPAAEKIPVPRARRPARGQG